MSAMPAAALQRIRKHASDATFFGSTRELTDRIVSLSQGSAKRFVAGKVAAGAYSKKSGGLFLDGGSKFEGRQVKAEETYAHELAHAIDGRDNEYSKHKEWQNAFESEIKNGKLSNYGKTSAQEAFAEFGRLVYTGGHEAAQKYFPKCSAFFSKRGLMPTGKSRMSRMDAAIMPDIFSEPLRPEDGTLVDMIEQVEDPAGDDTVMRAEGQIG